LGAGHLRQVWDITRFTPGQEFTKPKDLILTIPKKEVSDTKGFHPGCL